MNNLWEKKLASLEKIHQEFIGNTPLIEITGDDRDGARIFAKAEWHNMTGSIKDRVSYSMLKSAIEDARQKGKDYLKIVEYTGGNQGLSLSLLGNFLDIPITLVVPGYLSESFIKNLSLYGATVVKTDSKDGFLGAMREAEKMAQEDSSLTFLNQQHNPANVNYYENVMAVEILSQLHKMQVKTVDAWIASVGSGGTLVGVYNGLRKSFPSLNLYSLFPEEMPYGSSQPPCSKPKLFGTGGIGYGLKQEFIEAMEEHITEYLHCSIEKAYRGMVDYYKETGIFIGSSAAASLLSAKEIAKRLDREQSVLTVLPSLALQQEMQSLKGYF
uniref:cysteine synthase n=1 Tax=Candidatus Kentrum sp. MB TaxID=2138164 RepID=A0A451BFP3_9GAMM|nr:MAG: cysteine synthase A [Candidatus Kentron sp. MB]VFK35177.1 MAG: cysteine synthase A [Candidatus Kentron sp. MB]VFK77110.1 MAG: cysteine synthase A [Candidatus Kentron sp. MB]